MESILGFAQDHGQSRAHSESMARPASSRTVFVNGRFLGQRITGIQRYAREVLAELDEILAAGEGNGINIRVLTPRGISAPVFRAITVEPCGRFEGHLWEQWDLPWRVRDGLLFSFCPTGPFVKKRQVVTVHDTSVSRIPTAFSRRFRIWYELVVRSIIRRSPLTVTVSRFSAGEIAECYGIEPGRLRIATEGWQHLNRVSPDTGILDRHNLAGKAFALAVGSPTPNKNFSAIVQALELLGTAAPCCVAAGTVDPDVFRVARFAPNAIVRVGYASDEELKALYQSASCFIFPSFFEGFGIPPLEAMACGCPVLASKTPAVREVCGDAALYFDPNRPDELARLLHDVFADPELRRRLSAAGLEQAKRYSWREGARLNLKFMEEALCRS